MIAAGAAMACGYCRMRANFHDSHLAMWLRPNQIQ
jgi:hypothetical protein